MLKIPRIPNVPLLNSATEERPPKRHKASESEAQAKVKSTPAKSNNSALSAPVAFETNQMDLAPDDVLVEGGAKLGDNNRDGGDSDDAMDEELPAKLEDEEVDVAADIFEFSSGNEDYYNEEVMPHESEEEQSDGATREAEERARGKALW